MQTQCPYCDHKCDEDGNDCTIVLTDDLPERDDILYDFILCECGHWYKLRD